MPHVWTSRLDTSDQRAGCSRDVGSLASHDAVFARGEFRGLWTSTLLWGSVLSLGPVSYRFAPRCQNSSSMSLRGNGAKEFFFEQRLAQGSSATPTPTAAAWLIAPRRLKGTGGTIHGAQLPGR